MTGQADQASDRGKGRRTPRKATPERLRKAALSYVDRYAPTEAQLRRILRARVTRSARLHGTDPEAGRRVIEDLIVGFRQTGLLDDARYATAKADSLLRRGTSPRGIVAQLRSRGVSQEVAAAALKQLGETCADPELVAAAAYARKRRLGPYRSAAERSAKADRDLAALGRRGFSLETARRILALEDGEEVETLLGPVNHS